MYARKTSTHPNAYHKTWKEATNKPKHKHPTQENCKAPTIPTRWQETGDDAYWSSESTISSLKSAIFTVSGKKGKMSSIFSWSACPTEKKKVKQTQTVRTKPNARSVRKYKRIHNNYKQHPRPNKFRQYRSAQKAEGWNFGAVPVMCRRRRWNIFR